MHFVTTGSAIGDALRAAAADVERAEASALPREAANALARLARCYRAFASLEAAEATLLQALRWSECSGSNDATIELLCELCETAAALADALDDGAAASGRGHAARERARGHAFDVAARSPGVADARWQIVVLLRVSEVLDRCGDRDDAVSMQARALRLLAGDLAVAPDLTLTPALGRH